MRIKLREQRNRRKKAAALKRPVRVKRGQLNTSLQQVLTPMDLKGTKKVDLSHEVKSPNRKDSFGHESRQGSAVLTKKIE